ncbi:unnamed protein product [Orchesella dallaii]|uniref:Serine-threonine/tyrosine-protein kinase catalytic domain-containing protein n=1 Tax=Orchesella dallaii TaxID=48710 RepID=A0ABP1R7P5_9HEXA
MTDDEVPLTKTERCNFLKMDPLPIFRNLILFRVTLLLIGFQLGSCVDFNRERTGVVYSPFVYRNEDGFIPARDTYTTKNIKTMLEVISTKFSMISTDGVGAKNVIYTKNSTYYKGKQALTAEAAAYINRERKMKSINVIVGIELSDEEIKMKTELEVAFESAEISNRIYNGTVLGLVASHKDIGNKQTLERTRQALELVIKIKDRAHSMGLKVGTRQSCYEKKQSSGELLHRIANASDFIICVMHPGKDHVLSGGKAGFETVGDDLNVLRNLLKKTNPHIEVMAQIGWPSKGNEPWQTIDNLKIYWETANEWAVKNNFIVWFFEAFDNPLKNIDAHSAHYGWWKLRQNSDIDKRTGYAEKINEPREEDPSTDDQNGSTSPWVYIGVSLGIVFMLFIMGLFAMLFLRVRQLQDAVTTDDIREFIEGVPEGSPQSAQMENALKVPYDKSYEIPKDKLRIKRDEILGTGDLPYPGLSWNLDFVDSLVKGLRMKRPPHATPEIYKIMVDCWHLEPRERPSFTDLKLSTGHLFRNDPSGWIGNKFSDNVYSNMA